MELGYLSLLPVVFVLVMAFATRKVFIALLTGIIVGIAIIYFKEENFSLVIKCFTEVFSNSWSMKSMLFCLLIGSIISVTNASGGVEGLVNYLVVKKRLITSGLYAELLTYLIGLLLFIDGISSIVIAGVTGRPLFDKLKISRHKLAYIIDSTSSPIAWLFPINAAGAFLTVMIQEQISNHVMIGEPFSYILSAMPFQLYSIISILVVGIGILSRKEIGLMKTYSSAKDTESKKNDFFNTDLPQGAKEKAINMLFPLIFFVSINFVLIFFSNKLKIFNTDGITILTISAIATLAITGILYKIQKISNIHNYLKWCKRGMSDFLQMVIILGLSFAMSNIIHALDTGSYIANLCMGVNVKLFPFFVFLIGILISFTTGTSGGTVAILIPITIPLAANLSADIPLILGAIISSAVFGDHCSPISDSTILSSMIAKIPVMEHVKTQIPYALFCGLLSAIGFLLLGFTIQ
jgi:Na+/H+ antiporter NhaC